MTETTPIPLGNVITIDDNRIKSHLDRVVRGNVEETLNALLDAEADRLCNAQRCERSESPPRYARRPLRAQAADQDRRGKAVKLRIPKLRRRPSRRRSSIQDEPESRSLALRKDQTIKRMRYKEQQIGPQSASRFPPAPDVYYR